MRYTTLASLFIAFSVFSDSTLLAAESSAMKVDSEHVRSWNDFSDELYKLHRILVTTHRTLTVSSQGGYGDDADFYKQTEYFDADNSRLLSRIRWEIENPDHLHTLEIFIYDSKGRLQRDYLTAYLPAHRNAPIQTLINLHNYNDELHAFRQFDASGDRIYEQCKGRFFGEPFMLSLDEDEFPSSGTAFEDEMMEQAYFACFEYLPLDAGQALKPLSVLPMDNMPRQHSEVVDSPDIELRIKQYSHKLEQEPNSAELYIKRGYLYFISSNFEQTADDYTAAIRLDPHLDEAYFGRGMALGRAGKITAGIADLTEYIKRNPQNSLAYTKRGVRYIWKGDIQRAQADLQRALELDKNNAEAHDDLGVIYAQLGESEKAIKHFHAVIQLDPSYGKGFHNLAMIYLITGNNELALSNINDALKLNPRARNSLLLKSSILEAMGQRQQAKQIQDRAEFLPMGNWSEHYPLPK